MNKVTKIETIFCIPSPHKNHEWIPYLVLSGNYGKDDTEGKEVRQVMCKFCMCVEDVLYKKSN